MWYTTKIIVQQNPNFYDQVDTSGRLRTKNGSDYDKVDKTEYIFDAMLGSVFHSVEKIKPDIGTVRIIYGVRFRAYKYTKIGIWPFTKYEINWCANSLRSYEDIAEFYKRNMWKQLPSRKPGHTAIEAEKE